MINLTNTKLNKNKLLEFLNFHKQHYEQLFKYYINEANYFNNLTKYANEFNGKHKYTKFLIHLIEKGIFDNL